MGRSRPEIGLWYRKRQQLKKLGVKLAKRKPPQNLSPLEEADYYAGRDSILKKMGYSSYKEYLKSDLWKDIRARCMRINHGACSVCSNMATNIHHNRYTLETLDGVSLKELFPLCRPCHEKIEFKDDGTKRSMVGVQETLKLMMQKKWK